MTYDTTRHTFSCHTIPVIFTELSFILDIMAGYISRLCLEFTRAAAAGATLSLCLRNNFMGGREERLRYSDSGPRGRRKEASPSLHCSLATLDTVTRARCTSEIMKDEERERERERTVRRTENAGGSQETAG